MTKTQKIEIHVMDKSHITLVGYLENIFKGKKLEYSIIVDSPRKNRHYPYVTVNSRILCMKKITRLQAGV